ncbi:uncharacterized protein DSM5745_03339 [Aspergillus mulundensis]|uniref:protein-ribulosamine 3-kinase n=1 Tax=Aspergillus mulundensis TaxID=1810919 RepID=A0A3D8SK40_9EURO|nr:Uncharacterized protein DSM5745_03339 [Aspergillus mulundensis]RDW86697.1 Uncharacterized protein DSM5745_03339 [Aspergillus mulundensis]
MSGDWVPGIAGNFPLHQAVVEAMPKGAIVLSAETYGTSSWSQTAKVLATLPDGSPKTYFLKCSSGPSARTMTEGEYHSALAIREVVSDFVPKPAAWGEYHDGQTSVYFYLADFHDMDLRAPPDPKRFTAKVAELHSKSKSPTGMFGFYTPTVLGIFERTVKWETSWAQCFTNQLQDVIRYDNETNGYWPEFDAACKQLIEAVIPRLLGALQSEGRSIEPVLIHGSLWEQNMGVDMETGDTVVFDAGCTYAHNEMEFGTWRGSWAYHFKKPVYMRFYHNHIKPSAPKHEWDDRNRLYSLHPNLNDSAGHPGSISRSIAYNDMLFLCEKYAPLESLEKYNPENDIRATGAYSQDTTHTSRNHIRALGLK